MARQSEADYMAQFFSGPCARVTFPLVSSEHIRAAAEAFRRLADELDEVDREGGDTLGRVLRARAASFAANRRLKGGAHFKGAR